MGLIVCNGAIQMMLQRNELKFYFGPSLHTFKGLLYGQIQKRIWRLFTEKFLYGLLVVHVSD